LNNVKKLTIKYVASIISWITTMVLGEYLMQLDRKMDAKNKMPIFP
jgi:tetrahydromethanopterin S-methyltransferase subunit C